MHLIQTLPLLLPEGALACPLCHSSTAEEVREGLLLSLREGKALLGLLLPFLTLGLIVGWMHGREEEAGDEEH